MNENKQKTNFCVEKVRFVFHKLFEKRIFLCIFWLMFMCILVAKTENLTGFLTGLTGRSKNIDLTGAGRSDRFPSLQRV